MSLIQVTSVKTLSNIEQNVLDILNSVNIKMESSYIGEHTRWGNLMDKFYVTFKDTDTNKIYSTEFYQGIGHRIKPKNTSMFNKVKIVRPTEASILHSLILDSDCGAMPFKEFCDNFGYNYDSIKDLNLHRELESVHDEILKFFNCGVINKLRVALEDY